MTDDIITTKALTAPQPHVEVTVEELIDAIYAATWTGGKFSNKEEARDMAKALTEKYKITAREKDTT